MNASQNDMKWKKPAYAQTKYPRIYGNTYWGASREIQEEEIINNRNNLINDFKIIKGINPFPKYIYKIIDPNIKDGNERRPYDHNELYKTSDREYLLISSPYSERHDDYFKENGWEKTYPIYSLDATTYYKLIKLKG